MSAEEREKERKLVLTTVSTYARTKISILGTKHEGASQALSVWREIGRHIFALSDCAHSELHGTILHNSIILQITRHCTS